MEASPGGLLYIGRLIVSATAGRALYVGPGGILTDDANVTYTLRVNGTDFLTVNATETSGVRPYAVQFRRDIGQGSFVGSVNTSTSASAYAIFEAATSLDYGVVCAILATGTNYVNASYPEIAANEASLVGGLNVSQLHIRVNGSQSILFTTNHLTVMKVTSTAPSGQLLMANGSISVPTIAGINDTNCGFSWATGDVLYLTGALRIDGGGTKYLVLRHDGTNGIVNTQGSDDLYIGARGTTFFKADGVLGGLVYLANYRFSHGTSALATNATEGFLFLQSCAGVPTGTPASIPSGQIAMVVDSVSGQLNSYNGAWQTAPRTLDVNVAAVGNVGTGTDDLITYAIPANIFTRNNKTVRIRAWGTTANNANAKTLTFVVGSQTVLTQALTVSIAGYWEVEVLITRTGSNTQDIVARVLQGATIIFLQSLTAGTQTESGTITVKCTGNATSNNDIVQEGMVTEVIN